VAGANVAKSASSYPSPAATSPRRSISRWLVVVVLLCRPVFAATANAVAVAVAAALDADDPVRAAGGWWMVWGSAVDLGCLLVLKWAVGREGISLLDLVGARRGPLARQIGFGVLLIPALIPAIALLQGLTFLFYGGELPPQIALVDLPAWASIYSILFWPLLWAFTEQAIYIGYAYPRLEVLKGRSLLTAIVVILVWSLQHLALPFVPDAAYLVSRFLSVVPVAVTVIVLYRLLDRRVVPLMVFHWVADVFAALSPLLLK